MKLEPIEFSLKDGRKAVLRCPEERDIPGLLDYLRISAGETDYIMRTPEECGKFTPEGEAAWIKDKNASPNEAALVCEVDGKIAGNCEISFFRPMKIRHRGTVAIALISEFWGQGIGTKMFETMIDLAERREGITQLELDFVEGNTRARALYEKMGFRIVSVLPNAFRLKDGRVLGEYKMIREIKQ